MVKIILSFVALVGLSLILTSFLPWWSFVIPALAVPVVFGLRPIQALLISAAAFLAIYGGIAFWSDQANNSLLTGRIGEMFGGLKPWNLVLLSAIVPVIIGSLFAYGAASVVAKKPSTQ